MPITAPESIKDRFEAYRFFNGLAVEGKEGLDVGHTRIPLVKSFLIEHVSSKSGRTPKPPAEIFSNLRVKLSQIDDTFHTVQVPDENGQGSPTPLVTTGFLEQYDERFFAYYTVEHSEDARKLVRRWITHSSDLDSAWFSSQLLQSLWDRDVSHRGDNRIVKLTFKFDSIYEMPADAAQATDDEDDADVPETDRDDKLEVERTWKARSAVSDRIGRIKKKLGTLQRNYSILQALFSLRFPSRRGHGSHDLFQHGQITNRSDSFEDLHDLQADTDPSPLLLIYSDQDCPNPERSGYYRRVLVNQVVAKLVSDLNLLPIEQAYTITARELLQQTTDGVLNYLALDRQRNMIRIVRQNIFDRIASFWRDKSFTPVRLEGEHLQINFKDNLAKGELMDWLEDPKRTAFIEQLPPTDQPLLPGIEPAQEGTT